MQKLRVLIFSCALCVLHPGFSLAQGLKESNVAGSFYPGDPEELNRQIDGFLGEANPEPINGEIFALISPHAGYGYSGKTAAFGYKLIKGRRYKTVVVIAPSHHYAFSGISVYPEGAFRTPLGDLEIDKDFTSILLSSNYSDISFDPEAFRKEHAVEVQLPFLQKTLSNFSRSSAKISDGIPPEAGKIVPIVMGDCTFLDCQNLAQALKKAIGARKDVLIVASTDMYHGYDFQEAENVDKLTLAALNKLDPEGLYYGLRDGKLQFCGGFGVVATLILAKELGHNKAIILKHTNSAEVTGNKTKGIWTVGYVSCVIDQQKGDLPMLNDTQKKQLLQIARDSIQTYLTTGKKLEIKEADRLLSQEMGAFVTLRSHTELRGCIGNLIGSEPLYLTVRDMAIEAATGDQRFPKVSLGELKNIEIEISVLSSIKRITDPNQIILGTHGVLVKKGINSGVFLPQVATESGWSRDEFLDNLCAHKAGLASDAWKDKSTQLYIFNAEVFSENQSH